MFGGAGARQLRVLFRRFEVPAGGPCRDLTRVFVP